ncbi:two component transcriptional regulator, LuxR family [Candidatus Protofrankia datiscae]|uniref:Two component transcriptional regulator, LuxR family n=1 Tax=Candidatus Protofrankia datiscae TaxID=2716812 RepID=F8B4T5_9ACTN|nr:two component transcriptional regulator, LuxR family [Candidatus Protofrankia datiscae]
MTNDRLRVLLCDDHRIVRGGLQRMLAEDSGILVVADVGTAAEAVAAAGRLQPDIVVLDIGLPDGSGISAIGRILGASPASRVLMLTMHDDVAYLREAFASGALGYVLKAAADIELIQAIHDVARGERYVHPTLGAALLGRDTNVEGRSVSTVAGLSEREAEILRLLALGHTNPEMAEVLDLSVRTVETYRYRLQQKVGLRSRAELVRLAREMGLVR